MSKNRFLYAANFEVKEESWRRINWDRYPNDIKRIWTTCDGRHMFSKRFYFFSPSHRQVYQLGSDPLRYQEKGNSKRYCLIDDMNKRYSLYVNDRLVERTKDMSKIVL